MDVTNICEHATLVCPNKYKFVGFHYLSLTHRTIGLLHKAHTRQACSLDVGQRKGNNFNSDRAKRRVFLPTIHMLPPHIKRKKCKRKILLPTA